MAESSAALASPRALTWGAALLAVVMIAPLLWILGLSLKANDALMLGIEAVKPGNTFGDIGYAIQSYVESHRMSVVRDFCGHGLGRVFHAPPNVLHYGRPGSGPVLEEGMFFTIEPMVNLGRPATKVLAAEWTAVTRDKSLSAQFEHSVGVTADGVDIFTLSPAGTFHPTYTQTAE